MGYDSIRAIHATKIIVESNTFVALYLQISDSNMRVPNPNGNGYVMSRNWSLMQLGEEWRVMGRLVELASSCEGGMLKLNGRDIHAESLIKACRKEIKNAEIVTSLGWSENSGVDVPTCEMIREKIYKEDISKYNTYRKELFEGLKTKNPPRESGDYFEFSWKSTAEGVQAREKYTDLYKSMWMNYSDTFPWDYNKKRVAFIRKSKKEEV